MEWLNLKTSVLHAPEYIGSPPAARATWLNVSMWCATQENGGRIEGAASWGNRQWQQTCGVTRAEVASAKLLLVWDGDVLIVWNYPRQKEEIVKLRRSAGKAGGVRSGEARREAISEANNEANASTEGKGIGKEMERNGTARGGLPDSLNTQAFSEHWNRWQTHWSLTFNFGKPMPEMTAHQHLRFLVRLGETRAIAALENSIARGNFRTPEEKKTYSDNRPEPTIQTI